MQQMARTRYLSLLMVGVLCIGLFFSGIGFYGVGTAKAAEDWDDALEKGGKYNDDIYLDGDYDGEEIDPDKLLRVDGDVTISGDKIKFRNAEIYGDLIIQGEEVEIEDVEVRGNIEIDGLDARLEDVTVGKDVTVEEDDAELKRVTIEGDLVIEDDVEDSFTGKLVTVKGTVFVHGGGSNSVHFDDATLNHLEIDYEDVHVHLTGKTKVSGKVTIRDKSTVTLEDTAVIEGEVTVNAESEFYLNDSSKITGTVKVNRPSTFELESGASIKRMNINDDDVELYGTGTIEALFVDDEDDVYIDRRMTIKALNEPVDEPSKGEGTVIEAGKAGTVRHGNEVTVQIPEGAADVQIEVTIREAGNVPNVPANLKLLSRVYELKRSPDGTFKKPVMVSIAFDTRQLSTGEKPVVYYYDGVGKTWRLWGGFADGNKMIAYADRFAMFAVMAEKAGQTTPPPTTTQPATPPSAVTFKDVTGHWAEAQIRKAAALGIVRGYQDGTFRPDAKINRFEFAIMLARVKQLSEVPNATLNFKDADKIPAWARGLIASAVNARLVLGDAAGNFNPTANLTRVQMAVMIARAAGLPNPVNFEGNLPYRDASRIPAWARGAVASVTQAGLMSGSNGQFNPNALATRAQVAAVLVRLAER